MNNFLKQVTNRDYTENGAVSYATTGKAIADQFGKAGSQRGRDIETVFREQAALWAEDALTALRFPFYLRMITRKTDFFMDGEKETTEKVQKGQGARDEAFKRLVWIAENHPSEFYRNLWLIPVIGSWKDLWTIMTLSDVIDRKPFYALIMEGIGNESTRDLVKKYLPQIRSKSKCRSERATKTSMFAKELCREMGWNHKEYRQFKATGKAHEFQRDICSGNYKDIKWNMIPGKALSLITKGDFLTKHGIENSFIEWLDTKETVPFNGYPYELASSIKRYMSYYGVSRVPVVTRYTVDKQFKTLLKRAEADGIPIKGNVWCALDTSGSMTCTVPGTKMTALEVCLSLGIYFSSLNKGAFHDNVVMFDTVSKAMELKGEGFTDKYSELMKSGSFMGSTNFQSVIDELVRVRVNKPEIPVDEFPKTILVVSDMQFNPAGRSYYDREPYSPEMEQTNYVTAMNKLKAVFPQEFVDGFKIVWWDVMGRCSDVPSTLEDKGTYFISGFDGAAISFILGGDVEEKKDPETGKTEPVSMEEVIENALNQEILSLVN